jgi:transposase InsO family protein
VGLCLVHVAIDKASWLAERGIKAEWPVEGKPRLVSVDNGAEFHSAAFERGCEQHGIAIDWRPPGQPHFGGIVERVIGSLMKLVHELSGTTAMTATPLREYRIGVEVIPSRYNRYRRSRHKCFFHDPALLGNGPTLQSPYNLRGIFILTSHKKVCPQFKLWTHYSFSTFNRRP